MVCVYCGVQFTKCPSQVQPKNYCSTKCRQKGHSKEIEGKNNPKWENKIKLICLSCGKPFERTFYQIINGRYKYCSQKCFTQAQKGKFPTNLLKRRIPNHHTQPEIIFEQICQKHNLPFHYVGDGQLWIGKTKKLNPDFCELNGKKIVIEVMGDYWHSPLLNRKLREDANLNYRKRHYKKYGWESYFIWGSDLMRPDAEQFVLSKLKNENLIYEEG